ncbi:MAG: cysteine rich repeat-containing protein [Pseudomonadota bacterium]|nr:cysteine rich repeat-containing protein [Pseudomonadota bacterium]
MTNVTRYVYFSLILAAIMLSMAAAALSAEQSSVKLPDGIVLPPGVTLPPEASHPAVQAAFAVCNGDVARFCSGVRPGGGRILRCLDANDAGLTPGCRAGLAEARAATGR